MERLDVRRRDGRVGFDADAARAQVAYLRSQWEQADAAKFEALQRARRLADRLARVEAEKVELELALAQSRRV